MPSVLASLIARVLACMARRTEVMKRRREDVEEGDGDDGERALLVMSVRWAEIVSWMCW